MKISVKNSFALSVAAILAAACLGMASGSSHKSSNQAIDVTFTYTAKFNNGTTLPAGKYRMEISAKSPTPDVTFSQGGKVMATIKAKVVSQGNKNPSTVVDTEAAGDAQLVTAIHPDGWDETLIFGSAGQ